MQAKVASKKKQTLVDYDRMGKTKPLATHAS